MPFPEPRNKLKYSDTEDETPLMDHDEWAEENSSAARSSRRRRPLVTSKPSNNPRSTNQQHKSRTISFHASAKIKDKYPPNVVRNQKYNVITFFPFVLYQQFHIFINLYFLLVALSQFIPPLKIGYIVTYFGPLCFVLLVTIGKEAYDDWKRCKRDQENNAQKYQILTKDGIVLVPSSRIRVGDLVIIHKDQRIPADLVLLRTSEASGACFIRTDQLDGETDWKLRLAVPYCQKLPTDESLLEIDADIYADFPQKDIHNFTGNFSNNQLGAITPVVEALNVENTLWMNTVLASGTAIGFAIYTGQDTRAVMNTSHPETKTGLLDHEINRLSKILFVVTLFLSLTLIALNGFRGLWYIYLFRFLILFSSIIPIGLRVNLDMGKTVYGLQIMNDKEIPNTIVRTSTIPEELGRVEYLLSDKTGTLTKNDMELKKLHMGTISYGVDTMDEISSHLEMAFAPRHEPTHTRNTSRNAISVSANWVGKSRRDITSRIRDIVLALALCHNVTPVNEDGQVTYQASSPDEVAIVRWTENVGLTLVFRDVHEMHLRTSHGEYLEFSILQIFPFTSETKRMGIVVKEKSTGEIIFYEKGADVVMTKIVKYNDWLDEECGNMAREGLRTLVVARKRLSEEAYHDFEQRYHEAKISMSDRKAQAQSVVSSILEHDLELLGVTGVEDKLQDGVKSTLEFLKNAGLKIWMLTGDKIETATCIAISSKLIDKNQFIHTISKVRNVEIAMDELDALNPDCSLVIDGESLQIYLDHYRSEFIDLAVRLPIVVACRCTPTQKAEITRLIKNYTKKRICCIGDGGNDVSMIQAADVGVGIVGKEGKQASLAADFSITQFSHLTKLLLWHGRNSYKRSSKLAQFVIHRGLIISVIQAGWLIVGYSTIYTMAPVFSLVLDQDVNHRIAMEFPELYKELTKGRSLSYKTFFQWVMVSVYQGGAIMIMSIVLFEDQFVHIVSISFTSLILNELLMVALEINTWHPYMIMSEILTLAIYCISMAFLPTYFDMSFILTPTFVWKVALITAVSSMPLYLVKYIKRRYAPPIYTKLK
ncbi:4120_t:CDS:10 [Ambispora gerdemannii]|uniref:Phospholipid-transporting ATPase n=1 Tax=Ambispora gerdemannii TaxID=144530 RepID=A0A9N8Z7R1_9GLOM|nr:4120_t:CDS:10 [Ambispora gerdemannii]